MRWLKVKSIKNIKWLEFAILRAFITAFYSSSNQLLFLFQSMIKIQRLFPSLLFFIIFFSHGTFASNWKWWLFIFIFNFFLYQLTTICKSNGQLSHFHPCNLSHCYRICLLCFSPSKVAQLQKNIFPSSHLFLLINIVINLCEFSSSHFSWCKVVTQANVGEKKKKKKKNMRKHRPKVH